MTELLNHRIDGAVFGMENRRVDVTNPATTTLVLALDDVQTAVAAVKAKLQGWPDTPLAKQVQIMFRFPELLSEKAPKFAAVVTSEHSKVLSGATGEVTRGQEVVTSDGGVPHLMKDGCTQSVSTRGDVHSVRRALGPVAIIGPVNVPAMVPMCFSRSRSGQAARPYTALTSATSSSPIASATAFGERN